MTVLQMPGVCPGEHYSHPAEVWAVPLTLTLILLLKLLRREGPRTGAGHYVSVFWWLARPHLQRPLGLQCY
ncbi:hypothetical protein Cadr_000013670 [Camelus dromedarius]|uniref:Uncharacterized protein n=1 Tax=Camelus dromedarius TaxID=9838 RepID=A0A5N4DDX9_CAMDR|nr:hypothetical protein Cadr_000013670 [Camelus dromedarius]